MAEVFFTRRARRDLDHLDPMRGQRILRKIRAYAADPLTHAKKLTDARIGTFRWRIGDHRVIFDFEQGTVIILRVGDRKEIYS